MSLTDKECKAAKGKDKPYKMADGGGLYLLVKVNGARHWRLKYRFLGKEKLLAIGLYPLVSLAEAREAREAAKKLLLAGIDPMADKKDTKRKAIRNAQNTFKSVALEWHESRKDVWSPAHALNVMRRFEMDVFPYMGNRPIAEIDAQELLDVLRKIEKRGSLYMASRVKQICGQVFRYGIVTGRGKHDPSADLRGALKPAKTTHYAALDIKEMPEFLAKLERNDERLFASTRRGIKLLMLTFVRTKELIQSTWDEFDLDNAIWEIPAERMKKGNPHVIPLSRQAVEILQEQKDDHAHLGVNWVFPGQVRPKNHMSNNTILFAIGRLGYKGRMTGHGFRSLGMSTIKEKLGYRHEVVDRQLAHAHKSKVDRAYDRAQFLDERIVMMQEWADYMDMVAFGDKSKIIPFKKRGR